MRVASVCSSVGGMDLGLHRAGHTAVAFCEHKPDRQTVLNRHWPGVPVFPDLKELTARDLPACDLLAGGTPCQDLSHAGKRAGLDGERSGLFHAFAQLRLDLWDYHGCEWSLWENVAGALSSNQGQDFATVLASHVGADVAVPAGGWAGAGVAVGPWGAAEWRLLDAQYFGVPQRRRRIFVVGHLGADQPPEVLADAPRSSRHPAPRRQARPDLADGPDHGAHVAGSLTARYGKGVDSDVSDGQVVVSHSLTAEGFDASEDGTGRGTPLVASTLTSGSSSDGISAPCRRQEDETNIVVGTLPARGSTGGFDVDPAMAADGHLVMAFHMTQDPISGFVSPALGVISLMGATTEQGVRRLTPTECERLMGWPDGWTYTTGPSLLDAPQSYPHEDHMPVDIRPDGRRYAACGDGVAAPVAEWIGLGLGLLEREQVAA